MKEAKIPIKLKQGPSTAFGKWVVFAPLLKAGTVFEIITNAKKVPAHGYIMVGKQKIYFCLYGLFQYFVKV